VDAKENILHTKSLNSADNPIKWSVSAEWEIPKPIRSHPKNKALGTHNIFINTAADLKLLPSAADDTDKFFPPVKIRKIAEDLPYPISSTEHFRQNIESILPKLVK